MNIRPLSLAICLMSVTAIAAAQSVPGAPPQKSKYSPRGELVYKIVYKWAPYVQEAYGIGAMDWVENMDAIFAGSSMDALRKAADARKFTQMNDALLGAPESTRIGPAAADKTLGEADADLVLVPVAPCRILDTRVAGGAIAGNTTRDFDVTAVSNYSFQGGDASNCGGAGAAGSFSAAVINFTVVNPASQGFLTAYPLGTTRPTASTLNFDANDIKSNMAIVKLDQGASANELSVYAQYQTHLVADIVGYFIAPQPTALECITTANVTVSVAAGAVANAFASACPSTYTETGTNCRGSSFDMALALAGNGTCSVRNNSASAGNLEASRRCCRVPGR